MKVIYKDQVLAESEKTEVVEGNHYFPPETINRAYFKPSNTHTTCPWKGKASYYDVAVGTDTVPDLAWYYPSPKPAASHIRDYVAFYPNKVEIVE